MDMSDGLADLRRRIDELDVEIERAFIERMGTARRIGEIKAESGRATLDPNRERDVLNAVRRRAPEELAEHAAHLFRQMMMMSRAYQDATRPKGSGLAQKIREATDATAKIFPKEATVACQGVEGAYSQIACRRLFAYPDIRYCASFEDVVLAVESGECRYGVLPIENSSYGSVVDVYDLMKRYEFFIVRALKLRIQHDLLAKPGTKLEDIREVFSHGQAIGQCGRFLRARPEIKVSPCANTAVAAKMVAESEDIAAAAISSRECAQLYGLETLSSEISDSDSNYTRFICISKELEIYPGACRTSMMTELEHRPGSLAELLSKFALFGMNMTKIESRPIPGRDFEFKFYFEIEAPVYSDDLMTLLDDLSSNTESFKYLGSYIEH